MSNIDFAYGQILGYQEDFAFYDAIQFRLEGINSRMRARANWVNRGEYLQTGTIPGPPLVITSYQVIQFLQQTYNPNDPISLYMGLKTFLTQLYTSYMGGRIRGNSIDAIEDVTNSVFNLTWGYFRSRSMF